MRTFHTPFSPYNTHLSGRTPPYAQRHKMRVLSLLYRKGKKGRAASPERYRFFILIINFKIKQT